MYPYLEGYCIIIKLLTRYKGVERGSTYNGILFNSTMYPYLECYCIIIKLLTCYEGVERGKYVQWNTFR